MRTMLANIYLYLPLIFSNGVTRHVVEYDKLRIQPEIICNAVWRKFASIYLFLPLTLSNGVKRDVVEYDELRFLPEFNCNAVSRMFANIYLYLPLILSNGVTRQVVGYDKPRFPVIICNAVWEQCLQISIYISPLFSEMVTHNMLLSMINYYFSQKSFVMLCEECLQISIYFYPLFSQMVSHDMLLSTMNSDFSEKSFVMLYVKNVCKYLFIFTPYFIKCCHTTCCWVW